MAIKIIVKNKKVNFEYEILDKYEAGIVLSGTEVKSIREGKANISEAYCRISSRLELFLVNAHISPYQFGSHSNHAPLRDRKLLLKKYELRKLYGRARERGLTMTITMLYFKNGKVKAEIVLVKGKKLHDKRHSIRKKDMQRDVERQFKHS